MCRHGDNLSRHQLQLRFLMPQSHYSDDAWTLMCLRSPAKQWVFHYCDVILGVMASQVTSLTTVYLTVDSQADQRKHQSSASLAFVRGVNRWPVNSPHKWSVTRKNVSIWWQHHVIFKSDRRFSCRDKWTRNWLSAASKKELFALLPIALIMPILNLYLRSLVFSK